MLLLSIARGHGQWVGVSCIENDFQFALGLRYHFCYENYEFTGHLARCTAYEWNHRRKGRGGEVEGDGPPISAWSSV